MKFINRDKELAKLNELWEQKQSQLVVIYGKRRVGKTELIKQFLKKHPGIYFLADKRTLQDQLQEFARVCANYFRDDFLMNKSFDNWLEAFGYLKNRALQQQFIIAIDEYPYLAESDQSTSSMFQKGWDEYLKDTQVFIILCGSSIAMMESELLAYKAPLYGRLTGQFSLEPMDYTSSQKFFPGLDFATFLSYYTVTGGMPAYMQQFSLHDSVIKAVENLCWDKQGLYHNEVNAMLKQELRTPNNYFAILKAITFGKTRLSQIANDSGLDVGLVNKYLDTLVRLRLVKREVPITEEKPHKSKRGLYFISENFIRFWFMYVYAYSSDLEIGNYKQVLSRFNIYSNILEAIAYEQIARDHLRNNQEKVFEMNAVGRYWSKDVEIDGIGFNTETKKIVFMEAKWTNDTLGIRELNKLREKAKQVDWLREDRQNYYALYSKSGFSKELLDLRATSENLLLVHQDMIV